MKKIKFIVLITVFLMAILMLTACEGLGIGEVKFLTPDEVSYDKLPDSFTATKVGNVKRDNITATKAGLYYQDANGKYGIMSFDGKNDTGAIYQSCKDEGEYFVVSKKKFTDPENLKIINSYGLVDMSGKEIIPMEYASIGYLSKSYYLAYKATEKTDKGESGPIHFGPDVLGVNEHIYYRATKSVFDINTGKKVEAKPEGDGYFPSIRGDTYIVYKDYKDHKFVVNSKGEVMPEDAEVYDNGFYSTTEGDVVTFYNADDQKQFSFDLTSGGIYYDRDGYFVATKNDGTKTVLDEKGNVVSAEFDGRVSVSGELLLVDGSVYNFQGKKIFDGDFIAFSRDNKTKNIWVLYSIKRIVFIDKKGNVIFDQAACKDDLLIDSYAEMAVYRRNGEEYDFYSFADKSFSIKNGTAVAPWLVMSEDEDGNKRLFDSLSGNELITGYDDYRCASFDGSLTYVYAYKSASVSNEMGDASTGSYDIYIVK